MKTLMVVSGGDAPGINTTLAHYTALATAAGDVVVGAMDGFPGALGGRLVPLTPDLVGPFAGQAGSYLRSSRDPVLRQPDAGQRLKQLFAEHDIDNLVLFGGDGSLRHIPPLLRDWGIPHIGLPTTIDNDVPGTEQTLGFDSACNFAYQSVDGILATARGLPGRLFMLETLGGHTGFLALDIAFGAGAHAVLLPEFPFDEAWLVRRLGEAMQRDGYSFLVLSEGAPDKEALAKTLETQTQTRVRYCALGHAQRGAAPSHGDRVLAAHMARLAHGALRQDVMSGTVVVREGRLQLHTGPLDSFPPRAPDRARYHFVNGLEDSDGHPGD